MALSPPKKRKHLIPFLVAWRRYFTCIEWVVKHTSMVPLFIAFMSHPSRKWSWLCINFILPTILVGRLGCKALTAPPSSCDPYGMGEVSPRLGSPQYTMVVATFQMKGKRTCSLLWGAEGYWSNTSYSFFIYSSLQLALLDNIQHWTFLNFLVSSTFRKWC